MQKNEMAAINPAARRDDVVREHRAKTVYTGKELLEMSIREVPKLWEPGLLKSGISVLAGSSDCGKSTLARQLALAICKKQSEFLGTKLNVRFGRALIICTEDDVEGIAANLNKQYKNEVDQEFSQNALFMFDSENLLNEVVSKVEKLPCDLIVVDTWSDTFKGNTNDLSSVRQSLHQWRELSRKHACHVLLLHHTVKYSENLNPDKNRLNGSQAIEAKTRTLMELRHGGNQNERILTYLKSNFMANEEKLLSRVLNFDETNLTFINSGKTVNKNQLGFSGARKYENIDTIREEAKKLKQENGQSYPKVREVMVKKYGENNVPKLTWFKENCN